MWRWRIAALLAALLRAVADDAAPACAVPPDRVDDDYCDCPIDGGDKPVMRQLAERFSATGRSVISVERVPKEHTDRYGVVDIGDEAGPLAPIRAIVEKPDPADAPSNLAVVGRYLLTPRIFELLETTAPDRRGEIQLTDAIAALLDEQGVDAWEFTGKHYDCGNKLGYLEATVEYALKHPELGTAFADYLDRRNPNRNNENVR